MSNTSGFRQSAWERAFLIRAVEFEIIARDPKGLMLCPIHLSVGQEEAAAAICSALEPGDRAFGSHRCHAEYLAMGGNLQAMVDELHGLPTGCAQGRGGSMHLSDHKVGFMGTSAIVGSSIPIAAGMALSLKRAGSDNCAVAFFGDAALETGQFWEVLNMVALWKLPLLLVCWNNGLATATPIEQRQPNEWAVSRLGGWGIAKRWMGHEEITAEEIFRQIQQGRQGLPGLLEFPVKRPMPHVGTQPNPFAGLSVAETMPTVACHLPVEDQASILAMVAQAFDSAEERCKTLVSR